ncbi:hypothetical protein VEL57_004193, partial [Cronobacter sakazakii]|nr:hypothetical protein [Cronobacter sakazakii]
MKKIITAIISLFMFQVQANCDESWKMANYKQNLNVFKVVAKTFFYSAPNDDAKNSNVFLIRNDNFSGFLSSGRFEFGQFIKKDGRKVIGWLKKDDLAETTGNISTEINGGDFSIYSPNGSIDLSTPFEVFYKSWGRCGKNEQLETGMWSGFISKGDRNYKYFDYYWKGFSVRSSNINHEQLGDDFDSYRITTITVTNNKYITSRGIYVGMSKDEIIKAYGKPSRISKSLISYSFNHNSLDFLL